MMAEHADDYLNESLQAYWPDIEDRCGQPLGSHDGWCHWCGEPQAACECFEDDDHEERVAERECDRGEWNDDDGGIR